MKALSGARFSLLRRFSGNGSEEWFPLTRSGSVDKPDEFEMLLVFLFDYQLVRNPATLNAGLADVFWDLTQGVPDTMVKLWRAAQELAILSGREQLTPEVFHLASERHLSAVNVALNTLRDEKGTPRNAIPDLKKKESRKAADTKRASVVRGDPPADNVTPLPGADLRTISRGSASDSTPDLEQAGLVKWDGKKLR